VLRLKLKGLILDTIHHLSVVDELIDTRVSSINDWEWQNKIRFEPDALVFVNLAKTVSERILKVLFAFRRRDKCKNGGLGIPVFVRIPRDIA